MPRFEYLNKTTLDSKSSAKKKPKKADAKAKKGTKATLSARKSAPAPDGRTVSDPALQVEAVYLRRETIRAAWREYRADGGESLSELVEDLLLKWLRERA